MGMLDKFEIEPGVPMGFKVEITHPKMHCLLGMQYFARDEESDYNTFKLHFLWIALRWDWE